MKKIFLPIILALTLVGCSSNKEITKEEYVTKVVELNTKALEAGSNTMLVGSENTESYEKLAKIYQEMIDLKAPSDIAKDEQTFDSKLIELVKVCNDVSAKSKAGDQAEFSKSLTEFYKARTDALTAGGLIDKTISLGITN